MTPLSLSAYSLVSAIGSNRDETLASLRDRRSGLRPCDFRDIRLDTWIGRIEGLEAEAISGDLSRFDCRNNRLARMALTADGFADRVAEAAARYEPSRIAVVIGTSTSGILESELAYRRRDPVDGSLPGDFRYQTVHNTFSVADFTRRFLRLSGPATAISTACSSSAKAFASASRLIDAGFCDAAVVGGVDTLCGTTLYGFHALQLISSDPCRPADAARNGISIGEAAGFALLEKAEAGAGRTQLVGYGESADAYHMSSPHPEGAGALLAMRQALARAGVEADRIDHLLMHGTGTQANDEAEDRAIMTLFGNRPSCSSIKGWTGHTLGAAGVIETIAGIYSLRHNFLFKTLGFSESGVSQSIAVIHENCSTPIHTFLKMASGFGGSNASLVITK
jgi:3-oxoacyl-[acyl-carrier-protein] synthase-1